MAIKLTWFVIGMLLHGTMVCGVLLHDERRRPSDEKTREVGDDEVTDAVISKSLKTLALETAPSLASVNEDNPLVTYESSEREESTTPANNVKQPNLFMEFSVVSKEPYTHELDEPLRDHLLTGESSSTNACDGCLEDYQTRLRTFPPLDFSEYDEEVPPVSDPLSHLEEEAIEIEGLKFVDIGAFNGSTLELPKLNGLDGITVAHGNDCIIEVLVILEGYSISPNITKCKTLRNITLSGTGWICNQDWAWLVEESNSWTVNYSESNCSDVKKFKLNETRNREMKFVDGWKLMKKIGIESCPQICKMCTMIFDSEEKLHTQLTDCDNSNITDDTLPIFPSRTTTLSLQVNQIRSPQNLMNRLKHLDDLTFLLLKYNELDAFPYFPPDSFPRLKRLGLRNNKIRKINVDAIRNIITREPMEINLQGNNFLCDCNAHFFMKLCLENNKAIREFIQNPLRCTSGPNDIPQLITVMPDECEEPESPEANLVSYLIAVMSVMIASSFYLVYDLAMAIRECQYTGNNARDPWVHIIVTKIGRFLSYVFQRNRKDEEVELRCLDGRGGAAGALQEIPMVLRSQQRISGDRESFLMRPNRCLTPGPS